ncbi:MAG: dihydrofolate reductase [Verrucomicrobia bacterium]|nr:dihydrofolate reductase [Verrucomicrobiota bacterium]
MESVKPRLTLIAAMDQNHLLANSQGIPWKLPHDAAHFRSYTRGKWLLLGRKTFAEMREWFDAGHTPLVLSSSCGWEPDIGRVIASVSQALAMGKAAEVPEIVCCGGAQTYVAALPFADRMVLTLIEETYSAGRGAVYFPKWNPLEWQMQAESVLPKGDPNEPVARVITLERARK